MRPPKHSSISFGEQIEDYEVLNLLGKGGFASVYRARCLKTLMEVAIKMIDKKLMAENGMVSRVRQEVAIHSRLKHPSVLELYTFFEDSDYVYLVLEHAQYGELQRYIKNNVLSINEDEAAHIMKQVVEGLLYLHSHNILHRDLTLANLLLTKKMRVKIADFGLATQLSRPDEKHMTMCGTPNYISPEVAMRSSHGLEADVWGLGCMLYTLLAGKPPFDTDAVKSTLTRVVMAEFQMPSGISPEARDLIEKLLRKNPRDRIHLSEILEHPFISRSEVDQSQRANKISYGNLALMDSGMGTMSTKSTRSSYSSRYRSRSEDREKRRQALQAPALPTVRDEELDLVNKTSKSLSLRGNGCSMVSKTGSTMGSRMAQHQSKMHSNNYALTMSGNQPLLDFFGNPISQKAVPNERKEPVSSIKREENQTEPVELGVPPLKTNRLQPTRHKTKTAILSLLDNGEVCIELLKRKGGSKAEERVVDVCRISNDGLRIAIYKVGRHGKGIPVAETPPPLPVEGADSVHSYEHLPKEHWKKYHYAAKFISLVRAKTPKITLYTNDAKCILMENSPDADFEAVFYSGGKITKSEEGYKAIDKDGVATILQEDVIDTYSSDLRTMWDHFNEAHRHSLAIESALELTSNCSVGPVFPVIVGRRPIHATLSIQPSQSKENNSPQQPMFGSFNVTSCYKSSSSSKITKLKVLNSVSIPGIGTACQMSNGEVRIKYRDGSELCVNGDSSGGILFKDQRGIETKFDQSDHLDQNLRSRLAQVPLVLRQLIPKQNAHLR
ncbi:serine/threonine-protein kinase PLK4 isoform X2 [Cimex lectularius]|uniref:Serine/threonine-protein kinase PLK4 n=1 Tax=Cimex lectularius TaxID=79782 RepID=A0A8I6RNX2_CIMLE|nr:serine/threonine-protein kinase PLK4 isoform X2 [Cimex lectularius]